MSSCESDSLDGDAGCDGGWWCGRCNIHLRRDPALLARDPHDEVDVKVLEKDLVEKAGLDAGVGVVLLADDVRIEAQHPPEASDGASSAVLSLVAMYKDGMV